MWFLPLREQVVIRGDDNPMETLVRSVLPETAKDTKRGTVVAVGPARVENGQLIRLQVKPDDRVIFRTCAGVEVWSEDESCIIVQEQEILSIIG